MQVLARQFEQVMVFLLLLVMQGVFWPPGDYFSDVANRPPAVSDPYSTVFNAILIVFLAVACFLRATDMRVMLRAAWPMAPLIALAYLSAYWSTAPDIVLTRATKIVATAMFGLYLVGRGDMPKLIALLVKANLIAAAASFAVFLVDPKLAISTNTEYAHAWRGAFTDKNELGMTAAFGIILSVYAFRFRYGPRLLSGILLPANVLLLLLSDSITAVLVLPVALYVALLGSALGRRNGNGLVAAFALVVVGLAGVAVAAGWYGELLAAVGRNATLSNRTRIWQVVLPYIAKRPWLGYGLETFWLPDGVEANQVWAILQWQTPHSHNLWVEWCLGLGLVGAGLGALLWISAFWRAASALIGGGAGDAAFALVLLVAFFLDNMTEYEFFRGDDLQLMLFAAIYGYLGRGLLLRHRGRAGAVLIEPEITAPVVPATYRAAR